MFRPKCAKMVAHIVSFVFALMLMNSSGVAAQPAPLGDAHSPENLEEFLDQEGIDWSLWTVVGYEFQGLSFNDPILFVFGAVRLDTSAEAVRALEAIPAFIESSMVSAMAGTEGALDEFRPVSVMRIGQESQASVASMEMGSIGIVYVRDGQYVLFGMSATVFGNVVQTLTPYMEQTVERLRGDVPKTWQQLQRMLPTLDDMPPGYAQAE